MLKLNELTFLYCHCKSKEEQEDLIALCDLLGMNPYDEHQAGYNYDFAKYIFISGLGMTWQKSCMESSVGTFNIEASDFITANF